MATTVEDERDRAIPPPASDRPILESGDRLTRAEFHRRYSKRPDLKKAELVEGVVYVASPVRFDVHGEPHGEVTAWLGTYRARVPGVRVGNNATVFLDADNEVQPDVCLWREESGGPRLTEDGYIEGPPQLVVEVAASSASYDLHDKLRAYRRSGVREYVVWRVLDGALDWFRLREGEYVRIEPDARGIIESEVFPGLRLHVEKLLARHLAGVLAELAPPPSG
jgi:Uma2 family endonuclease